ncbi:hypothetical protein FHS55_000162 [Angulomicrobium tetraedrale]|uniref:Uncharacterized protein n=1 Tax=Ancylobacter tetraedralis TaxID=217068 RepID=A0A839Z5M7_9HYPH|nr:hypothetical protein [Ancylobacter tetraedralis]MBB3769576.1 hypothetical protein [Ancylobacter tetraedralis]
MVSVRPSTIALAVAFGLMLVPPALTALPAGFATSAAPSPANPVAASTAPVLAPVSASGGALQVPPAPVLLALLRGTLAAVNQANVTGNYSVLRDLGAPAFRENYNAAELADRFRAWRDNSLDFAAVLLLDAKLARAPAVDADGVLRLVGFFPTTPLRIGFDLGFEAVGGNWRLATISVDARRVDTPPVEVTPADAPPAKTQPVNAPQASAPPAGGAPQGVASSGQKDMSRLSPKPAMVAIATESPAVPTVAAPTVKVMTVRAATDPLLKAGSLDAPAPAPLPVPNPPGTVAKTAEKTATKTGAKDVSAKEAPPKPATRTMPARAAVANGAPPAAKHEPFAMNEPARAPVPFDMGSASGGGLY